MVEKLKSPLIIKHAQRRLQVGDICSLPAEDLGSLHTCLEFGQALGMQQTTNAVPWSDWKVMSDSGGGTGTGDQNTDRSMQGKTAFFTVLQLAPSQKKVLRSTAAHGKMPSTSIAVSMHEKKRFARDEWRETKTISLRQTTITKI